MNSNDTKNNEQLIITFFLKMKRLLRPFVDEGLTTLCHVLFFINGFNRLLFLVMLAEPDLMTDAGLSDKRGSSTLLADVEFEDTNPWLRVDRFRPSLRQ